MHSTQHSQRIKNARKIILGLSAESKIGLNPTVLHDAYHIVFDQEWDPTDARHLLVSLLNHPYIEFHNQSKRISNLALDRASATSSEATTP